MFFHSIAGRAFGLFTCCVVLSLCCDRELVAGVSKSSTSADVATKYKAQGSAEFRLTEHKDELLECSALAVVQTLIGDNLGDDAGSQVRDALARDYWIEVSHGYLALAEEASGDKDLIREVGIQIRGLVAEWQRLTETEVTDDDWGHWHKLSDLCDTWRPAKPEHAYFSKAKISVANQTPTTKMAMTSE